MITVCMATYNGSQYLHKQLDSILVQLSHDDEIVVQDDCSSDDTLALIASFNSPIIKVEVNEKNSGVITTFERALKRARGEVIFLSDQDDEWLPGKVQKVMDAFTDQSVTAVLTDAIIVDSEDKVISESYYAVTNSGPGVMKNYIHNSYLGCCLAFRRCILQTALPIPREIRTHDGWLGIVANMIGEVRFLPDKLLKYKRHGKNVSQMHRFPMKDVVTRRASLAFHLARVLPSVSMVRTSRKRAGGL